jgi:hypothetical protein
MNGDNLVVEGTAESEGGTEYSKVRTAFGGHEGYIKTENLRRPGSSESENASTCLECGDAPPDGSQCMCTM